MKNKAKTQSGMTMHNQINTKKPIKKAQKSSTKVTLFSPLSLPLDPTLQLDYKPLHAGFSVANGGSK